MLGIQQIGASMKKHFVILGMGILISSLHYLTPIHSHYLHAIYQRLYYIPILLACYFFPVRVAVAYAVIMGMMYVPHILFQWTTHDMNSFTQYVEVSMFLIVAALVGVLFDIRQRQQDQILSQQKQLAHQAQLGLLGKLAAGLAHEIRNPLGSLLGSTEIIKEGTDSNHPNYEFILIIEKELNRVNAKLNDFLNFARPQKPDFINNHLNDIVSEVAKFVSGDALKLGIHITLNFEKNLSPISIDAEQIRQVILNIVLNSLAMQKEGGLIHIQTKSSKNQQKILVQDEGPGIDPKDYETIFEPFFTKREKGTGLGLSISRQLVEAHGGTLMAVPSQKGARFELTLPISPT